MPTPAQRKRLWDLYRITPEEQQEIEAYQRGHKQYRLLLGGHMGTDHCHLSGLIRGRLDWRLNKLLGVVERFPEPVRILRALADYLESPPAVTAVGKKYGLLGQAKYKKKMIYGALNTSV